MKVNLLGSRYVCTCLRFMQLCSYSFAHKWIKSVNHSLTCSSMVEPLSLITVNMGTLPGLSWSPNETTTTHTHTQMGPYKPLCVPWVFDPLSALVGRAIKGSTPTWEQYPSSPECPQISLCLTQSLALFSLLFPFVGLSRSLPFLSSSFYFSPFFLSLPITPFYFLHLDYFLVALSD